MGQVKVTVGKFTRLRNTTNGNGRWVVQTDKGVFRTKPDGTVGYEVERLDSLMYGFHDGMPVVVNINDKGQIDKIELVDEEN